MISHILALKHKRHVSFPFRFQWQKLLEKLLFGQFFLSGYFLMYSDWSRGIFFVVLIIWFYLIKSEKQRCCLIYPGIWAAYLRSKKYRDWYNSDVIVKCMLSIWFKMSNCKIAHCRFFRQSVTKTVGKTAIRTILCFSPLPFLTMLRNNEQKLRQTMLLVQNIV